MYKIRHAKDYIDRLADGVDPFTGAVLDGDTILNNVQLSRCFFFVSDVLRRVIDGEFGRGGSGGGKSAKPPFAATAEQLGSVSLLVSGVSLTVFCKHICESVGCEGALNYSTIANWLLEHGYLSVEIQNDKKSRHPTALGQSIGIVEELRDTPAGDRMVVVYRANAQRFILDNLLSIIA